MNLVHQLSWCWTSLNRSKDLGDAIEPIQMMLKALYRAEETGARLLVGWVYSGNSRSLGLR